MTSCATHPFDRTRLRVFYAIGPGDAVNSYTQWRCGSRVAYETAETYSGEFFEVCKERGYNGYAVSWFAEPQRIDDGWMIVENRPKPPSGPGWRYHLSQLQYGLSLIGTAVQWHADVVIVDSGTTHWIVLALLKLFGIQVIGCFHNLIWPKGYPPRERVKRLLLKTDAVFWNYVADGLLSVSLDCERQVRAIAPRFAAPAMMYNGLYKPQDFPKVTNPRPYATSPLEVMFSGRVEEEKGVFDLLKMARILEGRRPGRACFHVYGAGSALGELRTAVAREGLASTVHIHGHLNRSLLLRAYSSHHVVIVPTRSGFNEGFAKVCAEAVLTGRPIITSPVVPAAEVLALATLLARTDDPGSYADLIVSLLDNPELYEQLCGATEGLRQRFLDRRNGLGAAIEHILDRLPRHHFHV